MAEEQEYVAGRMYEISGKGTIIVYDKSERRGILRRKWQVFHMKGRKSWIFDYIADEVPKLIDLGVDEKYETTEYPLTMA